MNSNQKPDDQEMNQNSNNERSNTYTVGRHEFLKFFPSPKEFALHFEINGSLIRSTLTSTFSIHNDEIYRSHCM